MAITTADLKFFQSERMTDNSDGGGRQTAVEIITGTEGMIFDGISDVDRAAGDVSIRKVYASVNSANTDKYLDSGVCVMTPPTDSAVTVALFSTGSFFDTRNEARTRLEQTITRGSRWNGWLWGQHLVDQRAITLWQRTTDELPQVGARLELVKRSGGNETNSQFLWVTRVTSTIRVRTDAKGTYTVTEVVLELSERLLFSCLGPEPSREDPAVASDTPLLYATRYNSESVPIHSIKQLTADASATDYTVNIGSLYVPIVPTALTETALPDTNPNGNSINVVRGGNELTLTFTNQECLGPNFSFFLGSGIYPGSLSITSTGVGPYVDDAGKVVHLTSRIEIGIVDYGNGIIRYNASAPTTGTNTKTVKFKVGAKPLQQAENASVVVTPENRGFVWVNTLFPIPQPGTTSVSYRVANKWYVLTDKGNGMLTGADTSYGSGSINFNTGTVTVSTGEMPDVYSSMIYSWGVPSNFVTRGGAAVDPASLRCTLANTQIVPGSVTITWGALSTPDNGSGVFSNANGVGTINYSTGAILFKPTTIPVVGTSFSIAYQYGAPILEQFAHPVRNGEGKLEIQLANTNVIAKSVEVEWNVLVLDYEAAYSYTVELITPDGRLVDPIKRARDNGSGALVITNGTNGIVNYSTGLITFLPDVTVSIPKPLYDKRSIGTEVRTIGNTQRAITTWRTFMTGYEYIPSGASYPIDESGFVNVRYRVAGVNSTTEVFTLSTMQFDLTKGYGEAIVPNSVRFSYGNSQYADINGQIYRDWSVLTGVGTLCGTVDFGTGVVTLSNWGTGANSITLQSLVTNQSNRPTDKVVFRTPIAPVKAGTLQLRYTTLDGVQKSKTVDGTGILEDSDCYIRFDVLTGVCEARFGVMKLHSALTNEEKLEPWYSIDAIVTIEGVQKIWKPRLVLSETILYNAVGITSLPPDSTLLGINSARLPIDGRALVYSTGRLALIHDTRVKSESTLASNQQVNMGRERLYTVVMKDNLGARIPYSKFSVNRTTGIVTMSANLDLTGFTAPYKFYHTVADLARIVSQDINGDITFNKALSHDYNKNYSYVSSVLYTGTMQARVANMFSQSSWTSVWSDTIIGSPVLNQFNSVSYPIIVSNLGSYTERFLIRFTDAVGNFQVIGENFGLLRTGTASQNCVVTNPSTLNTMFEIDYRGWGGSWPSGYCLRFNLVGASYPINCLRAVQPSAPLGASSDNVELIFIGNV